MRKKRRLGDAAERCASPDHEHSWVWGPDLGPFTHRCECGLSIEEGDPLPVRPPVHRAPSIERPNERKPVAAKVRSRARVEEIPSSRLRSLLGPTCEEALRSYCEVSGFSVDQLTAELRRRQPAESRRFKRFPTAYRPVADLAFELERGAPPGTLTSKPYKPKPMRIFRARVQTWALRHGFPVLLTMKAVRYALPGKSAWRRLLSSLETGQDECTRILDTLAPAFERREGLDLRALRTLARDRAIAQRASEQAKAMAAVVSKARAARWRPEEERDRDLREEVERMVRTRGASQRAIAKYEGVSRKRVARALRRLKPKR